MRTKREILLDYVGEAEWPRLVNCTDRFLVVFERVHSPTAGIDFEPALKWVEFCAEGDWHYPKNASVPVNIYVLEPKAEIRLRNEHDVAAYCNFEWDIDQTLDVRELQKRIRQIFRFKTVWDMACFFIKEMEYADG